MVSERQCALGLPLGSCVWFRQSGQVGAGTGTRCGGALALLELRYARVMLVGRPVAREAEGRMDVQSVKSPGRLSNYDTSAGKALALLDAFVGPRSILGVSELAALAQLPKSTAFRLLNVLVVGGYLHRVGDQYSLSDRVFEVGSHTRLARPHGLRDRAMPFMAELFGQTRQTIHLAVLAGTDVLYLEKLFGHESLRLGTAVGGRRPAYATALGKAMLAFAEQEPADWCRRIRYHRFTAYTIVSPELMKQSLTRVHEEGLAFESEESMLGVACVAVPILNSRNGRAIAALSLSTPVENGSARRFTKALAKAAEQLSTQLTPFATEGPVSPKSPTLVTRP
jgi:DNA-binding IclR family transcriptional regulator